MKKTPTKSKKANPWELDYRTWHTATLLGIIPKYPYNGQYDYIHRDGSVTRVFRSNNDYVSFIDDTVSIVKVRQA